MRASVIFVLVSLLAFPAFALDLDWSGQFSAEANFVKNYSMENGNQINDATRSAAGGYYIPGGGSNNAHFQSVFLKLKPTAVVNDNVYVKSEVWLGDPIYGFFGSGAPYTTDQRRFYSTQVRGSTITAQRVWGEFVSDFGTLKVGRAPLHWGLGVFWNSGDDLWDRYPSTADQFSLVSKFGSFVFSPTIAKYSAGNNIGGACVGSPCVSQTGGGGMSDYSFALKYDNLDEDFEGGVNYIRRIAGAAQDPTYGYLGFNNSASGMSYSVWDIYMKKKLGRLNLGVEFPITNGTIGGTKYSTFALAGEVDWQVNDKWETKLRAGRAPGQPNISSTSTTPDKYNAFYFHPDYMRGLIMFNYALNNFAGPNTTNNPANGNNLLVSPYDNPISNAKYVSLGGAYRADKWKFRANYIYAVANDSARAGQKFYNVWSKSYSTGVAVKDQSKSLGWEMDYGTSFYWDDHFQFHLDFGWFFPGKFYDFSNTPQDNATSAVFATTFKVGVQF